MHNLQNFAKASKFQKTILSLLMGLKADKNDLNELRIAFKHFDLDNDGHLTKEEFKAAEKKLKVAEKLGDKWEEVLQKCDLDGDGKIDFGEFYTAAVNHQKIITAQNIKYAFDMFDVNGDGSIDIEEFKHVLPTNKKTITEKIDSLDQTMGTTNNDDSEVDPITAYERNQLQDNQKWKSILQEVDKNGDGLISFEEFTDAIMGFIDNIYKI